MVSCKRIRKRKRVNFSHKATPSKVQDPIRNSDVQMAILDFRSNKVSYKTFYPLLHIKRPNPFPRVRLRTGLIAILIRLANVNIRYYSPIWTLHPIPLNILLTDSISRGFSVIMICFK